MSAASFVTFSYWAVFGLAVVYLFVLVGRGLDRRARVRRMRERRLRRQRLNEVEPQRWVRP